jgi:hypothetical protein
VEHHQPPHHSVSSSRLSSFHQDPLPLPLLPPHQDPPLPLLPPPAALPSPREPVWQRMGDPNQNIESWQQQQGVVNWQQQQPGYAGHQQGEDWQQQQQEAVWQQQQRDVVWQQQGEGWQQHQQRQGGWQQQGEGVWQGMPRPMPAIEPIYSARPQRYVHAYFCRICATLPNEHTRVGTVLCIYSTVRRCCKKLVDTMYSVADPDPGSGAFLSRYPVWVKIKIRIRNPDPG